MSAENQASRNFTLHGPITQTELCRLADECVLSVAPLLSGAGVKGKVNFSLSRGLPCVVSPIAAEGMGLESGAAVVVAHGAQDFAGKIAHVATNEQVWTAMSKGSIEASGSFTHDAFRDAIRESCFPSSPSN